MSVKQFSLLERIEFSMEIIIQNAMQNSKFFLWLKDPWIGLSCMKMHMFNLKLLLILQNNYNLLQDYYVLGYSP